MTKIMKFIGRAGELGRLGKLHKEKVSQFAVLYGRRRVGKTALLTHFCKGKPHFYFTGRKGETSETVMVRFLSELSVLFDDPLISKVRVSDWKEIFEIIDMKGRIKKEKIIIVMDEFQWMCGGGTLLSSLQEHWDKKWKDNGKMFLVLCGSIVSFMEKEVLSEKSPLYGRRTMSFELEPLPAYQAKLFFSKLSLVEQAEIVMTFGGIPSYLELIDQKMSLQQNINSLALTKNAYFVNEVQFVLREQLKKTARYYLLLELLSGEGMSREELAQAMGVANSGALALYLKKLQELRLIKSVTPIIKKGPTRCVKFIVWDEFLRFYFKFIHPNIERIQMNEDDWLYDAIIAPKWESYCGYSFELFCAKNIKAIVNLLGIKKVFCRSGAHWQKATLQKEGVQIDMVLERADKVTHLLECKWSTGKVGMEIVEELERKKKLYPNPDRHTLKTALITTHGVTKNVEQSRAIEDVITLRELMEGM